MPETVTIDNPLMPNGTVVEVGKKQYRLNDDETLTMLVAVPVQKNYARGGLLARKAQLEAELVEIDALLAKQTELIAAK